jgi:hypothetical protein
MKKLWLAVILACPAGMMRLNPWPETPPRSQEIRRTGIVLTGTLAPVVSIVLPAREIRLEVPMYSWVSKGQIIGEGVGKVRRVGTAERSLSRSDDSLEVAQQEVNRDESALISAEVAEQQAESRLSAVAFRSRQQIAGVLEEDEAVAERDRASAALAAAQRSVDSDMARVSELERYRPTRRRLRRVAMPAEEALTPIPAPMDGMLIPAGGAGEVGLAADPDAVCIHAMIPAYDLVAVRVGRIARVTVDGTSTVVSAKVSAVSADPVEFQGRSVYPMTLTLESLPKPILPGTASVHLYLE